MLLMRTVLMIAIAMLTSGAVAAVEATKAPTKTKSIFVSAEMVEKAKANAARYPWAAEKQQRIVERAQPWMKLSDNDLWNLMFGATIPRSWMVWSNGFCPACKKSVPMYNWKMDAFGHPWKTQCPHCKEFFPKNDFKAFYDSGLDEHGVFDSKLADRSLLFNTEHPDPKDPLHKFGVDDGTGYVDGENKWRFIGAYLIYGQWKQAIVNGIGALGEAYCVTGDPAYAHKAAILLDRVADLYPTFDFATQAEVYEVPGAAGYVSTWHDACGETRTMAMSYDRIFDAIKNDKELVRFLAVKAKRYKLDNPKATFADIQRNIEDRILRDSLANRKKVESNYPQTDLNAAMFKAILEWPASRDEVDRLLGDIVKTGTQADGLSGEKGMCCYSAHVPRTLADMLEQFSRIEPGFLTNAFKQHPSLYDTWQFYIDTWALQAYNPNVGDSTTFVNPTTYQGIGFGKNTGLNPSGFTFLSHLHEITGDPAYLQLMYIGNGNSVADLPHDLFADDPEALQRKVQEVVDRHGTRLKMRSSNKEKWRLALLRSGEKDDARVVWLDYDSTERHRHMDCMNLGMYAKGIDLMADFGYPPVQYGGWGAPKARWFTKPSAHNTVVIDGADQPGVNGKTTMWADGKQFQVIRASAPEIAGKQYERTAAVVGVSPSDFYVLDLFRVVGGKDHAKFMHTQISTIATSGLRLAPAEDYGLNGSFYRNTKTDAAPEAGWSVDWAIDDQFKRAVPGPEVHVRYTDLTTDVQVSTCEAWVSLGISTNNEAWIPTVMVRRESEKAPLSSTFVGVIEPYYKQSNIASIRRLRLESPNGTAYGDSSVAVEVTLADGRRDVIIAADAENPLGLAPSLASDKALVQKENGITLAGEMCMVRFSKDGKVEQIALCKGESVTVAGCRYEMPKGADFMGLTADGK